MNRGKIIKCRACLASDKEMIDFDEKLIIIFNDLTNLEAKSDDRLSQHLCKPCHDIIELFVQFREKCVSVQKTLDEEIKFDKEPTIQPVKTEYDCEIDVKYELEDITYADYADSPSEIIDDNLLNTVKLELEIDPKKHVKKKLKLKPAKKKLHKLNDQKNKRKPAVKQLTCGLCPEVFTVLEVNKFHKHLDQHKKDNKCDICSVVFSDWYKLFAHRLIHVPSNERCCYICKKRFRVDYCLEFHYKKEHSNEENVGVECTVCAKKFKSIRRVKKHMSAIHSGNIYVCDYCKRVFHYKQLLKIHMSMHLNRRQYKCKFCDFTANFRNNVTSHIAYKHTKDKVICKKCKRVCLSQGDYETHQCKEKPTRMCPICGKLLKGERKSLDRHLRSHSSTLDYKCKLCPVAYKTPGALRVHTDKHDNNPRHRCEFCGQRFYYSSVLIKHRRVHTGIKPYVCKICSKAFTGRHNLKVHMRVHGEHLVVKKGSIITSEDNLLTKNGINF